MAEDQMETALLLVGTEPPYQFEVTFQLVGSPASAPDQVALLTVASFVIVFVRIPKTVPVPE